MSHYNYKTKSRLIKGLKPTGRQLQFVTHYLRPGPTYMNATQSAIAIGIKENHARQMGYQYLRRIAVKNLIATHLNAIKENTVDTFKENLEYARHIRNVSTPLEEKDHTNMDKDASIKAMDLINKMQGHYAPEKMQALTVTADTDLTELEDKIKEFEKEF